MLEMQKVLSKVRWFFTGLRLILPLVPHFVWFAFRRMIQSLIDYWKDSQSVVQEIADHYTDETIEKVQSEYDTHVFWVCFSIASFLYLVGWLFQAWIIVEAFRFLVARIF